MIHDVQYKNYSCECPLTKNPPTVGKSKKPEEIRDVHSTIGRNCHKWICQLRGLFFLL